jgi:hypothetical protein
MPVKVGSKAQVFHGTADRTAGGLTKDDLMQTDKGRIVSKKQHKAGLNAIKRLRAAGFVAKKGEFKLFAKRASKSPKKSTRKMVTRSMAASRKSKAAATRASKKAAAGGSWY